MSLNCAYKDIEWSECCFDKTEDTICDADMIVPDAKSDIAKIISVNAQAAVFGAESSAGRITVTGEVKFNVLYIGDEENGKINSVTKKAPFTHICVCDAAEGEITSIAEGRVKACNFTVVNSRRLRITSSVAVSVKAFFTARKSALVKAEGAETLEQELPLFSVRIVTSKEISLNETVDIPAGKPHISEILRVGAAVTTAESKVLNNKLIAKGSILVSILYLSDSSVCDASLEIPFTEVLECEGISPSLDTDVSISVSSCDITPDTDLSGEYKMINAAIVLSCSILASRKENVTLISDVYLPHGSMRTECAKMRLYSLSDSISEEEFVKESINLASHPPILRIFDFSCAVTEVHIGEGGIISGFAEAAILYISSDPSNPIASYTGKIPFSHKTAFPVTSARARVNHVSYSITSDDEAEVRLSIVFNLSSGAEETVSFFTSAEEQEYTPPDRPSVIISFVRDGDTLWSVAKKHSIALSELTSANALEHGAALQKGAKLIIPR